jgi:hypothetical protein
MRGIRLDLLAQPHDEIVYGSIANCGFPTIRPVFEAQRLVEKRPLP